ncbi:MAG: hypothetical protein WDW38_003351 [Sanguina aurantia]
MCGISHVQERIDSLTMEIKNPNMVGSGFISFPPQKRFEQPMVFQPPTVSHIEHPEEYTQYFTATGAAAAAGAPAAPRPAAAAPPPAAVRPHPSYQGSAPPQQQQQQQQPPRAPVTAYGQGVNGPSRNEPDSNGFRAVGRPGAHGQGYNGAQAPSASTGNRAVVDANGRPRGPAPTGPQQSGRSQPAATPTQSRPATGAPSGVRPAQANGGHAPTGAQQRPASAAYTSNASVPGSNPHQAVNNALSSMRHVPQQASSEHQVRGPQTPHQSSSHDTQRGSSAAQPHANAHGPYRGPGNGSSAPPRAAATAPARPHMPPTAGPGHAAPRPAPVAPAPVPKPVAVPEEDDQDDEGPDGVKMTASQRKRLRKKTRDDKGRV